jgi:hypothetical protein
MTVPLSRPSIPPTDLSVLTLREADRAASDLRGALCRVGFTLPSLRADFPVNGHPHAWLGGASADVTRRLTAWVSGRGRQP